ncbi:MAG: hypothetical protein QM813_09300 [Verrucomicrobiota bacterium]
MGFFGSGDKTTSVSASQTGVSDDGMNIGAGGAGGKDSSINVAGGLLSTTKIGSTEVGTLATNSLLNSTNTGTITYGLGAADVSNLLADTTGSISSLVKQQSDAAQAQVTDVVAGLQDLALSKQTNGESARDNTILWIVGFVIAGLAAILLGGKRGG